MLSTTVPSGLIDTGRHAPIRTGGQVLRWGLLARLLSSSPPNRWVPSVTASRQLADRSNAGGTRPVRRRLRPATDGHHRIIAVRGFSTNSRPCPAGGLRPPSDPATTRRPPGAGLALPPAELWPSRAPRWGTPGACSSGQQRTTPVNYGPLGLSVHLRTPLTSTRPGTIPSMAWKERSPAGSILPCQVDRIRRPLSMPRGWGRRAPDRRTPSAVVSDPGGVRAPWHPSQLEERLWAVSRYVGGRLHNQDRSSVETSW